MEISDSPFLSWLVEVRRDLHRHPEIAFQEKRTSQVIARLLEQMGLEVRRYDDLTGVVGLLHGRHPGPTLALRADIDALPIRQLNDVPYRSVHEGMMHACGHDGNTTVMLGAARLLAEADWTERMHGRVKFIFQPAEERVGGAKAMIERRVLEDPHVDRVLAAHMSPDLGVGRVGVFHDVGYASADRFQLHIEGQGAHAARPEEGRDPIVAGAHWVTQVQSIPARNIGATRSAVITVGKFISGEVANAIPQEAWIEGSIRTLTQDVRDRVLERLGELAEGIAKSFDVHCDFRVERGVPVCANDPAVAEFVFETCAELLGRDQVSYLPPIMASEDFAYFAQARPSAIIRLGCSNPAKGIDAPLHSAQFDMDEEVLEIGARIFAHAARRFLEQGA